MTARVIHFGWDHCHRVQVLRAAGYEVREALSLETLELDLERDGQVDAVVLSEDERQSVERACEIARSRSSGPVIVFRRSLRELDERKFDLVYPWVVSPHVWLAEAAELIAQSRASRAQAQQLRGESQEVRKETRRQRERLAEERKRNKDLMWGRL